MKSLFHPLGTDHSLGPARRYLCCNESLGFWEMPEDIRTAEGYTMEFSDDFISTFIRLISSSFIPELPRTAEICKKGKYEGPPLLHFLRVWGTGH